jgi:nitrogenase-associated protein
MAHVIFYEKPGCGGNARQRALLTASGHVVEARSLLDESWSAMRLRRFFGARPVVEWFNPSSPRVKSGEVDPSRLTEDAALEMMLSDPLLIRRPLMQVGERREVGFEQTLVDSWIGLAMAGSEAPEACVRAERKNSAQVGIVEVDPASRA